MLPAFSDVMRLLFLTHYFPPEVNAPASRTFEHCKAWVAAGHQVTVLTCFPNHPYGKLYPGYRHGLWLREQMNGVEVVRVWTFLAANEGFVKRTINYLSFMLSATLVAFFLRRPGVVVSTSPQFFCGLAGYLVARLKGAPWVLEVRDLWPDSIVAVGAMRDSRAIRWLARLESAAYRKADGIVSVTESFRDHIEARAGAGRKVTVIKNGLDLENFGKSPAEPDFARSLGLEGKFVAAYIGTHGMAHGLEVVLEAATLLRHEASIAFLLVGEGAEALRLRRMREEAALDNVVMLGQQPRARVPAIWHLTGAALVLLRKADVFKTVIPSKLIEAMGMGRPVILGVEGEAREIVERATCGIAVEPGDARQLADVVRRLAQDPQLARRLGDNGRACVYREYDRKVLAERYLRLLENVAKGSRPTSRRSIASLPGSQVR